MNPAIDLRTRLVQVALEWEKYYGIAPSITTAISELDAALLFGMSLEKYRDDGQIRTAVTRGHDFVWDGLRYQVTANRPSGKKGSHVTLVSRKTTFDWERLVWLLYDRDYNLQEAWFFEASTYQDLFAGKKRLSPADMRHGNRLFPLEPIQQSIIHVSEGVSSAPLAPIKSVSA